MNFAYTITDRIEAGYPCAVKYGEPELKKLAIIGRNQVQRCLRDLLNALGK